MSKGQKVGVSLDNVLVFHYSCNDTTDLVIKTTHFFIILKFYSLEVQCVSLHLR